MITGGPTDPAATTSTGNKDNRQMNKQNPKP